ncbi:MAG TPA: S8 family serine peptidase, partial [Thermoanaerobaculia bacterium]|nr:S8 family serine peptidase [Thermoanaerobaculia bacterium]
LDARIFPGKAAPEKVSFLVLMKEQADLSGADRLTDRAQKRRFVFEALRSQADRTQADLRMRLNRAAVRHQPFYIANMLEVEGDLSLAEELASREDVSVVAPNTAFRAKPLPPQIQPAPLDAGIAGTATVEANIALIGAPQVWARGFTGQGIVIGMADTGFTWTHPALKPHYRGFDGMNVSHDYNWHDAIHDARMGNPCGSNAPAPCDDDSHGTATASLAVGDDGAGNQIGAAPGARFIGCRNMDEGDGTPARYTECFQFFLAPTDHTGANPRPDLGADVISNSWGCPASEGCTDPNILKTIVENVRAAGVFVVVAASNDGPLCATIDIPGLYEAVFSVGATTNADVIADFSSRGPVTADGSNRLKPDLCAPGVNLRVANLTVGYDPGFSGTSGSTPEVAGAVALLWSAAPHLIGQISATADVLRGSASPLTSSQDCSPFPGNLIPNAVFGYGRIDVAAAVDSEALVAREAPLKPTGRGQVRVVAPRP